MPKVIKVTRAQIMAAQALIKMYERGVVPEPGKAVRAIAAAKRKVTPERDVVFEEA